MRPLLSLIRREFAAYFLSPVAYVTITVFLFVTGRLFDLTISGLTETGSRGIEYPMERMLGDERFWLVFLFIPPLLTMRLLAEERGTGTLESLLTAPIRDWQVVAGKYIGALMFYIVLWIPTVVYLPILLGLDWHTWQTKIDPAYVISSYVGVFLAGAMFLAIGLLMSSLVKNQLAAAMISMVVSLIFVLAAFWRPDSEGTSTWDKMVVLVSVPEHFRRDFARGVIDTRHAVLYLSVTALCLFLTVRSLEGRRLRA